MKNYSVAIVGATGAVGRMMLKVLEEQNFPISELYLLASKRSKNKTIQYLSLIHISEPTRPY